MEKKRNSREKKAIYQSKRDSNAKERKTVEYKSEAGQNMLQNLRKKWFNTKQ